MKILSRMINNILIHDRKVYENLYRSILMIKECSVSIILHDDES